MIGRVMNVSGIPYIDFGYRDNNHNQQREKKKKQPDFGDILANEIKSKKLHYVRRLSDD